MNDQLFQQIVHEIKDIKVSMLSKKDFESMATKSDLESMATKNILNELKVN